MTVARSPAMRHLALLLALLACPCQSRAPGADEGTPAYGRGPEDDVSLIQVRQEGHHAAPPASQEQWVMSPMMNELCQSWKVRTSDGIMAMDNPCKRCVAPLSRQLDMKYVIMVAEA
eukprot:CAMPEP_0168358072 /NCGR_PEP_ID=MMETSP0228-20121227/920_1 /TAXON_ID=133427 /ORGANISM="Protoceratium reticulatum, Strain CCCM 535 (=CCMP 1889)" /LENGTH=116 /DNA_ID=CAMNT_0008370623 /DNA_START=83 /DNA_END=429 /DNA_ORIENTATION=-